MFKCIFILLAIAFTCGAGKVWACYDENLDDKTNYETCKSKAIKGDADAQFNLGVMYGKGEIIDKDLKKSGKWFLKSAKQGHAMAQFNLAAIYTSGLLGLPKDYKEALNWYTKASEQGLAIAQFNLGVAYAKGLGTNKDFTQAKSWYLKAAKQGVLGILPPNTAKTSEAPVFASL